MTRFHRVIALFLIAAAAAGVAAQPTPGNGVFSTLSVGVGSDASVQEVDVRSGADGLGGGIRISRADGSYLVLNMDDSSAFATIQAADNVAQLPTKLSPNGGGVAVGSGTAFINVLTGTGTWDPLSIADGAAAVNAITVTGVTTSSTCFASFSSIGTTAVAATAQASSSNTVTITLTNNSGSAQDFASGTLRAVCFTY